MKKLVTILALTFVSPAFAETCINDNCTSGRAFTWTPQQTFLAPTLQTALAVASLGTCVSGQKGAFATVYDGDAGLYIGQTVVNSGAGATYYPVTCNGSAWVVSSSSTAYPTGAVTITPTFGATCNDATWAAADASDRTIVIPSGTTCTISADLTMTTHTPWIVEEGAAISVASTKTLTFKNLVNAGRYQIFTGAGTVLGIAQSKPEWWGAVGTYGNTTDSRAAVQAAYNSARASFLAADPAHPSDTSGKPLVDFGYGYFNLCTPVDIYPDSSSPIEFRGTSSINGGSTWINACSTFVGEAPIIIHGSAYASGYINEVYLHDFSVNNQAGSAATSGIRFVPEGTGYWLNAAHKSIVVENVSVRDFPRDYDISNTRNAVFRNSGSVASAGTTTNHTAVRLRATGAAASGNVVGEVRFENFTVVPCPEPSAATCTNTIGYDIDSSAGAAINAITWSTAVIYRSNTGVRLRSDGVGTWLGDLWMADDGNQFDGPGCAYIDAQATNSGDMFNIHIDHVYHTGVYATSCNAHYWYANGGTIRKVWDTNNEFILGPSGNAILFDGVTDYVATGNILDGNNNLVDAVLSQGTSSYGVISSNVVKGTWRWGVVLGGSTAGNNVSGNTCSGATLAGGTCVLDSVAIATTTNNVYGNGDPAVTTTVAGLPTCNAANNGRSIYVTDASAPTYNATLTGGGAVKTLAWCDGANWTAH